MLSKLGKSLPTLCLLGVLTLLLCPSALCDCRRPPKIAHGSYQYVSSSFSFTTVISYECDKGYVLSGRPQISCRYSGWSSPLPQCKALCLKPEIENGHLSVNKTIYVEPETVTVQCDPGYRVVSSGNITCSESRKWYPEVPKCEWEVPEGCEDVEAGNKLMQCLPNPENVKEVLEIYKLLLEIQQLKREKDSKRNTS